MCDAVTASCAREADVMDVYWMYIGLIIIKLLIKTFE